jgi:YD repeat-containing protein
MAGLPLYDGNHADHWGFFNNKDLTGIDVHSAYTYRETDPNYVTTGLLTTITYPTGGYSNLTWEAHDYSQYVSTDRTQLLAQSTNTTGEIYMGGSRIKNISSYTPDGTLAYQKSYLYKRGYNSQVTNPATLTSSGILNGLPQYVFDFQDRLGIAGDATFSVHMAYLNTYANYGYNGEDSYIGYDEVAELERDGSYTRHFFTSYAADYNGVSHFDQAPAASIGWVLSTDKYAPHTDLDRERGKLVAALKYSPVSSGDILLKKTVNTYRSDAARTSQFIKRLECSGGNSYTATACASDGLVLATANKMYTYMYYPVTETVTNYDQSGSNPVTETTNFTYDANNMVLTKALTNSKNELVTHAMQYTTEATDATSVQMAGTPHMLNYLIQETVTKTPPGQSALLQQINKTLYYSPATGLFEKQYVYQQNGSNALELREQFYQYDAHGNVQEESKATDIHDVYLWSYNSQYPVAKIKGSTYSAVIALLPQAQIDAATVNDASMRSLFTTLRSQLPGVFITSYTYSPVYGMTSQTDPQGRNTYYDYDGFGRLVAIRDQDNNIIKRLCYNYAGQPESCGLYYNGPQSGTYTTACKTSYLGGPVTYTVPAQTYTGSTLAAANQLAENDVIANGQNYANATGTCREYWTNTVEYDVNYTKNICGTNMTGQTLTYRVLVGTDTSFVSQTDANQLAYNQANDIGGTNGQAYVNQNGACTCNYTTVVLTINPGASAPGYRAILINSQGVNTTWNFPTSGSTTVTTTLPSGTYTIGFAPTGGPGANHTFTYAIGPNTGTVQNSTSASFPNVAVSCNLTMTIY